MNTNNTGDIRELILDVKETEDKYLLDRIYFCYGAWLLEIGEHIRTLKQHLRERGMDLKLIKTGSIIYYQIIKRS
jgi:hypothetical protein